MKQKLLSNWQKPQSFGLVGEAKKLRKLQKNSPLFVFLRKDHGP
jgi:hypothetical protein